MRIPNPSKRAHDESSAELNVAGLVDVFNHASSEKLVGKGEPEETDKCMISRGFYCIKIEKSMLTCKPENDDALAKPPSTQRDKW